MALNAEQSTLEDFMAATKIAAAKTENLPAPISPEAQAIIAKVDQASVMLKQATNDYERLYVRDRVKAVLAAAEVLKLDDVVKRASVMVQRAERAIAKANPPQPGKRTDLEPVAPGAIGLSTGTLSKMRTAHDAFTDDEFEQRVRQTLVNPEAPPMTRGALIKEAREKKRKDGRAERQRADDERRAEAPAQPPASECQLLAVSITELHRHVAPNSIDVIFTEPPYGRKDLPLYTDLARFAQQALKPGGLLLTLSGSRRLPEIYRRLDAQNGMNYRHHFVYNAPSANATLKDAKIHAKQQPLICYSKGDYAGEWQDDLIANQGPKRQHEVAVKLALAKFATPGMTVCDPFMGQGAVGAAARTLGCAFIGNDIDEACVADAEQRIAAAVAAKARQDAENPWLPGIA